MFSIDTYALKYSADQLLFRVPYLKRNIRLYVCHDSFSQKRVDMKSRTKIKLSSLRIKKFTWHLGYKKQGIHAQTLIIDSSQTCPVFYLYAHKNLNKKYIIYTCLRIYFILFISGTNN